MHDSTSLCTYYLLPYNMSYVKSLIWAKLGTWTMYILSHYNILKKPKWHTRTLKIRQKFILVHITISGSHSGDELHSQTGHYSDVIMSMMASQITSLTIVYSPVYSDAVQRRHQSSASLAFVRGIHQWTVNSTAKNVSIWWRHHARMTYCSHETLVSVIAGMAASMSYYKKICNYKVVLD